MDFKKWCAQANLGVKRSRIYQLMGPDPIAGDRREEKHSVGLENVQSVDIEQFQDVEQPAEPPFLSITHTPDSAEVVPSITSAAPAAGVSDEPAPAIAKLPTGPTTSPEEPAFLDQVQEFQAIWDRTPAAVKSHVVMGEFRRGSTDLSKEAFRFFGKELGGLGALLKMGSPRKRRAA
jgi:hypothetical protein